MVRFEKEKLVIEIESRFPESAWLELYEDLLRMMGAVNKEMVDSRNDCIYGVCDF